MLLRNCQWFCTKDMKLLKFSTRCTKLPEGFVVKLRNSLQFSELKKVLYENYETFFMLRNLKSFRKTVLNLQSSVEHLFFYSARAELQYLKGTLIPFPGFVENGSSTNSETFWTDRSRVIHQKLW